MNKAIPAKKFVKVVVSQKSPATKATPQNTNGQNMNC